jgi:hypothetical protein
MWQTLAITTTILVEYKFCVSADADAHADGHADGNTQENPCLMGP